MVTSMLFEPSPLETLVRLQPAIAAAPAQSRQASASSRQILCMRASPSFVAAARAGVITGRSSSLLQTGIGRMAAGDYREGAIVVPAAPRMAGATSSSEAMTARPPARANCRAASTLGPMLPALNSPAACQPSISATVT